MTKRLLLLLSLLTAFCSAAFAVVDVNTADQATLDTLPGIGPVLSKAIVVEREKGGPFKSAEDLSERVKGIGDKSVLNMEKHGLVVGGGGGRGFLNNIKNSMTTAKDAVVKGTHDLGAKAKDSAVKSTHDLGTQVNYKIKSTSEVAGDVKDKAKNMSRKAKEKVADKADTLTEDAHDKVKALRHKKNKLKEKMSDKKDGMVEDAQSLKERAKQHVKNIGDESMKSLPAMNAKEKEQKAPLKTQ